MQSDATWERRVALSRRTLESRTSMSSPPKPAQLFYLVDSLSHLITHKYSKVGQPNACGWGVAHIHGEKKGKSYNESDVEHNGVRVDGTRRVHEAFDLVPI